MAERVHRFVEWALESDRYVMVEIVEGDPPAAPRRYLSTLLQGSELTSRLISAGVSSMDVARLMADARERARADRGSRSS